MLHMKIYQKFTKNRFYNKTKKSFLQYAQSQIFLYHSFFTYELLQNIIE